ncbi:MAG: ATP synthase F1 subunit epsilon [Puniceicoccales bacterium]|jgi:F-type H+-transporting ATPase subunit epsilon|nr:ATP synthase F1 subunit epsilon [Puniceicoccales bacterium]
MSLFVEIITPGQVICSKEVASLVVDSAVGELEILPEHRPLVAILETGSTRLKFFDGTTETIATSSGILNLENNRAILMVEEAVNIHELRIISSVGEAKLLAKNALKMAAARGNLEQSELDRLEAKIRAELNKKLKK